METEVSPKNLHKEESVVCNEEQKNEFEENISIFKELCLIAAKDAITSKDANHFEAIVEAWSLIDCVTDLFNKLNEKLDELADKMDKILEKR